MAEKYSTSKLINLHSADGSTLLIPKIPLSTVDNNAYTVVDGAIVTKGAGVSLQAAVQAEIAAAIADDVVGNYVPWTDGSNVEIPGTLTVEGATTLAALSAEDTDITGTLDVTGAATLSATLDVTGAATLNDTLTVAKAATLKSTLEVTGAATLNDTLTVAKAATFSSDVVVQGKLTVAQEYTVGEVTSVRQAEVATQNYVQTYVADQIAGVPLLSRKVEADDTIINTAPTKENLNIIYMIPQAEAKQTGKDIYDEYMAFEAGVDDEENTIYKWQLIGNTDIDLSGYYTSAQVDQKLGDLAEEFAGSGLVTQKYVDDQDAATSTAAVTAANGYTDAEVAKASSYADEAIAEALDGLKVDGKDLKSYIDAQDNATSTAAVTAANGYTDTASNTLSAAIIAVDNKFANYYDKDGIAGLGYATITQVNASSAAAVAEANGYTDDALANYFDKDHISANYVPWTSDCDIVVSRSLIVNEDAYIPKLFVGDSSTLSGTADIYGDLNAHGKLYVSDYAQFHNNLDVGYGALAVSTNVDYGSDIVTMGSGVFKADLYNSTVTLGSMFEADLYNSTVKVYDEWTDGQTTSTGLANVATEHDIADVKSYTDDAIADALEAFKVDGKDLKTYIDEQDDAHQAAAEATAKAYTDAEIAKLDSTYATDAELAAASSNIMSTINALPGVGEGAILYDIIDEQI